MFAIAPAMSVSAATFAPLERVVPAVPPGPREWRDRRPVAGRPSTGHRPAARAGGGAGCLVAAGVAWAASADVVAVGDAPRPLQVLLAITGICVACRFYGVFLWLDRRRSPAALRPMATQKIRIQR